MGILLNVGRTQTLLIRSGKENHKRDNSFVVHFPAPPPHFPIATPLRGDIFSAVSGRHRYVLPPRYSRTGLLGGYRSFFISFPRRFFREHTWIRYFD